MFRVVLVQEQAQEDTLKHDVSSLDEAVHLAFREAESRSKALLPSDTLPASRIDVYEGDQLLLGIRLIPGGLAAGS